ncbi:MAG: hypothetical protein ACOCP4_01065 [Candidatus Woesearchaeota archaeon]
MQKCKEKFPNKVFCNDCRHKKHISFNGICEFDLCKVNYIWEYNYKRCWKDYIECEVLNASNNCPDFEPKVNIFKKILTLFY